jgi:hypothetical protein
MVWWYDGLMKVTIGFYTIYIFKVPPKYTYPQGGACPSRGGGTPITPLNYLASEKIKIF